MQFLLLRPYTINPIFFLFLSLIKTKQQQHKKNNLNPNWVKVFVLDYDLGHVTKVAISIFDEVRKGDNKSMGSAIFDIGEVLGARGSTQGKKVKGGGRYVLMRYWEFTNVGHCRSYRCYLV